MVYVEYIKHFGYSNIFPRTNGVTISSVTVPYMCHKFRATVELVCYIGRVCCTGAERGEKLEGLDKSAKSLRLRDFFPSFRMPVVDAS